MNAGASELLDFELPPTQDELPYEDGVPMETPKHRKQAGMLADALVRWLEPRRDVYVGANMALYFSVIQARNQDFRAPDLFVVLGGVVEGRERKSWVMWEENGRRPDVVVELLSTSTEAEDRGRKMQVYAGLGVAEYFLVDPLDLRLEGYRLDPFRRTYARIPAGADGDVDSAVLGLKLGRAGGTFEGMRAQWMRWKTMDGTVLPTGEEAERARADAAEARAGSAEARAERLEARLRALGIEPE